MRSVLLLSFLLIAGGCLGTLHHDPDLFAAIKRDDGREVERLLSLGANVNLTHEPDYDGLPPLGWASGWASASTVELLIAHGANVNGANRHGTTPLHLAAYHENPAVTALLIRNGASVNARNEVGWTALHKAMEQLASMPAKETPPAEEVANVRSIVKLLLASGAKVDVQSEAGGMPIHVAALTRQKALVQMLIDKGAGVDARSADGMTPLYQAARKDAAEVAQLLIARGADVNARTRSGNTPLLIAADQGSAEVAKLLVAGRADVNARGKEGLPPLVSACRSLLIRYTIEAPTPAAADLRRRGPPREVTKAREALGKLKGNFSAVAELLIESGADPNVATPGFTPLGAAATVGDIRLARALIAHGAALDDTSTGESALHAAIAEGHADVAELLIGKGANVKVRNTSGLTPLHFLAGYMHDRKLAELLIQHGADVSAKDQGGEMPLEFAIRKRNNEVAEVLRQHGAK